MTRPLHPTALITGGNRGIGYAIAQGLIAKGCTVTIAARTEAEGRTAADALNCRFTRIDLLDPDSYFDAFTRSGGWDILVNNAGVLSHTSLLDKGSDFAAAMEVMVAAPLDLIRLNTPYWKGAGWGRIVNMSSGLGSHARGLGGPGAYSIAKASLNALTRALPRDLPASVKVNACDPGWVDTRMGRIGGGTPPLTPQAGADTAVWLALLPDDGPTGGFFCNRQPAEW